VAQGPPTEAHATALLPRLIALPARLAPARHAADARTPFVIVTALSLGTGCLFFALLYALQGNAPVALLTALTGALAIGVVPALGLLPSLTAAIHALALLLTVLLAATEALVGGPNPSNLFFMSVTPIAALFAGGASAGLLWLLLTWITIGALFWAAHVGLIPPCPESVRGDVYGVPVVIGMVFGFAYAFERLQRRLFGALEDARIRAEQTSIRRGDMLASMSHELRTPMNGVIGMTHALLSTPLTDEQRAMLQTMQSSGRSLVEVINDILDFERIDRGLLTAGDDAISPAEVVTAATRVVAPLASQAGLPLSVVIHEGVPAWVRGDAPRLRQILVNLLGNAVKYTQEGRIEVTVERDGDTLCFRVRDTGPGVAAAMLPRLFRPFSQGTASSHHGEGSGLGLAISRGLATLLGGTLSLEHAGPGAVFLLRLPCRPAAPPTADAAPPAQRAACGHRVLVVEDNPVNEAVARAYLKSAGAHCEVAGSGEDAIARLAHEDFDLVLMDLLMPGIDGAEVTRRVRAMACRVPVVAMTASVRPEDRARCFAAGMDDFLAKPLSLEDIARVLARFPPQTPEGTRSSTPGVGA
jgi:signal transduction histidine kinase/CheY-like chemotaxis protein